MQIMCQEAGVDGKKTNHSLRATGATQLYQSGVPEKLIQERTGHRSLEALRVYERTNKAQHKAVSSTLSATKQVAYSHQVRTSSNEVPSSLGQYNPPGWMYNQH